jgi:hypothetical protein
LGIHENPDVPGAAGLAMVELRGEVLIAQYHVRMARWHGVQAVSLAAFVLGTMGRFGRTFGSERPPAVRRRDGGRAPAEHRPGAPSADSATVCKRGAGCELVHAKPFDAPRDAPSGEAMRPTFLVLMLAGLLALPALTAPATADDDDEDDEPLVVIAHIDTGINPYNRAFRDASARALQHPCTYLRGYPCSAPALPLHLDAPDMATALQLDAAVWGDSDHEGSIVPGQLYWIPGTRIVGAMRFTPLFGGGTNCPLVGIPPANILNDPTADCPDHPILDDHGHGTMTASRMAGSPHSLCPTCRIVSIEGLTPDAVKWVADQGWIDVQTNSWVDLVPPVVNQALQPVWDLSPELRDAINGGNSTSVRVKDAAARMPVFFASGNGAAYLAGFAPTPTYLLSTGVPGVILVGGDDNGKVTAWAGAPPHVVADAYGGWAALRSSFAQAPDPIACCTSAASPYAAGGGAAIVREARRVLHSEGTGVHDGVLARAPRDERLALPGQGPLADGVFTLREFKALLFHTAEARPQAGRDDGLLQWVGSAGQDVPLDLITTYGPGANPFCNGCWTLPVDWSSVPRAVEQWPLIGYGGVDERSVALATAVLAGRAPEPQRATDDLLYRVDQQVREVEFATA